MSGSDFVPAPHPDVKLTYDDFLQFPDDGKRHEVIDGEHFVTPSQNTRHRLFYAPFDVVFSNFDVVEPDLLYVSKARESEVLTRAHVRGAPNLVVEIGSPSTRQRDETIKRRLYERFGVDEYWVIADARAQRHLRHRLISRRRRSNRRYQHGGR